jgi:hypothetical protein
MVDMADLARLLDMREEPAKPRGPYKTRLPV